MAEFRGLRLNFTVISQEDCSTRQISNNKLQVHSLLGAGAFGASLFQTLESVLKGCNSLVWGTLLECRKWPLSFKDGGRDIGRQFFHAGRWEAQRGILRVRGGQSASGNTFWSLRYEMATYLVELE